jgi:hypothetical protein
MAKNSMISQGINDFSAAWRQIPGNPTEILQDAYIRQNPQQILNNQNQMIEVEFDK